MPKFICKKCGGKMLPKKEVLDAQCDEKEPWGAKIEHVCCFECPKCGEQVEVN